MGAPAPAFELDWLASDGAVIPVRLSDSAGAVRLLNVINSIDTPVCSLETRTWDERLFSEDSAIRMSTVSMDLPFALDRWRTETHAGHQFLSAHRDERFGVDYGVLLKQWRLLQRAVFVIDREDRIAYAEYVPDQMREPNYSAAEAVIKSLA
ncbi:redoxin family protein [Fodinicola feengrottensis]|uniref:redoxin family protein n=1 Tax=Fodinicola feengrottensis TaxID=435914 RepID=UPI002441CE53|nr:redoxin family protein [Fodinicola feengrottensis]